MNEGQVQGAADFAAQHDTFCRYLADQLITRHGFVVGAPQAAADIAAQSDYILTFHDGYSPEIIGLIDRDAHPGKAFTLSAARVQAIAEACRVFAGSVVLSKLPVVIQLMEVGGATPDQPERLGAIKASSFFSKLMTSAWAIDTDRRAIWTTADRRGRARRRLIQGLLDRPREAVVAPIPVVVARRTFPWLTSAMIAALIAIFAAEVFFGVGDIDWWKQPTIATLLAFGGLMGNLVANGDWYRLFTAPLLHAGFAHIALNAVSLAVAGFVLEPLIGRAWFAATFAIGAIGGALLSFKLNPDMIVAVGASGAVMALFGCMLVLALRFPRGEARRQLQMSAAYVLIPSLLPLASVLKGIKVDYAAHFGGAFAGVLVGGLLLQLWRANEARPRLRVVAVAVAVAGLAAATASGVLAQRGYPIYELSAALAPSSEIQAATGNAMPAALAERYPRDPRARFLHALALARIFDLAGAEAEARAGLAEEALWSRAIIGGDFAERLHGFLALLLFDRGRQDEAKDVARAACTSVTPVALRWELDKRKLCAP